MKAQAGMAGCPKLHHSLKSLNVHRNILMEYNAVSPLSWTSDDQWHITRKLLQVQVLQELRI